MNSSCCQPQYLCNSCMNFYICYEIQRKSDAIYKAYNSQSLFNFENRYDLFNYLSSPGGLIPLKSILDENYIAIIEDISINVCMNKLLDFIIRDKEHLSPLRILCNIILDNNNSLLYNIIYDKTINENKETIFKYKDTETEHVYYPLTVCYKHKFIHYIDNNMIK